MNGGRGSRTHRPWPQAHSPDRSVFGPQESPGERRPMLKRIIKQLQRADEERSLKTRLTCSALFFRGVKSCALPPQKQVGPNLQKEPPLPGAHRGARGHFLREPGESRTISVFRQIVRDRRPSWLASSLISGRPARCVYLAVPIRPVKPRDRRSGKDI